MVKYFSVALLSFAFLIGNLFADSEVLERKKETVSAMKQMVTLKHLGGDQYSIEFLSIHVNSEESESPDLKLLQSLSGYPSDEMFEKWNANENFRVLKDLFTFRLGKFDVISSEKPITSAIVSMLSALSGKEMLSDTLDGQKSRTSHGVFALPYSLIESYDFGKYLTKFVGSTYLSEDNTLRIKCTYISLSEKKVSFGDVFTFVSCDEALISNKTYNIGGWYTTQRIPIEE